MKIQELRVTKFRRFSDLVVGEIAPQARLVLLVGPNGSGKSSLIDAAYAWHRQHAFGSGWDEGYHRKQEPGEPGVWQHAVQVTFHDKQPNTPEDRRKAIYVRSAYRNEPEFQLSSLSRVNPAKDEVRFARMIDNDQVVGSNYMRLVSEGFEYAFEKGVPGTTFLEFREGMIGSIRDAMIRLFPGLVLNSLGNPLTSGTFKFSKGDSQGFLYKNLSGGEKAAFDLMLDLQIKLREFDDTVFFIDEPEAHLASSLQGALLEELFNLVPAKSQLWIATHSLGMMRRARDLDRKFPGAVVFLDFDGQNFDLPSVVGPTAPSRPFWKRAMQIALDDMAGYVAPERVVLCEGGTVAGGSDFDAACYNAIFGKDFGDVLFLGAGNADDVENDPRGIEPMLKGLAPLLNVIRLVDRDDRAEAEIEQLRARSVAVLSLRTIESYLLDDEILTRVCSTLGDPAKAAELLVAKAAALAASVAAGGPADDLKRPAGDVYNAAKKLFPTKKLGNNNRAFMRGVCAPEVVIGTATYDRLHRDIFGPG